MSFPTSTTLTQLINFLTRPLILTHPAIAVAQLQLVLHANLSAFLPFVPAVQPGAIDSHVSESKKQDQVKFALSPFTLHLSPYVLPIAPIYAACISSGIPWEQWIRVLTGGSGKDVYVFVMEGCIRVGLPHTDSEGDGEMIEVWKQSEEKTTKERLSPMTLKLQAALDSVRARKAASSVSVSSDTLVPRAESPELVYSTTGASDLDLVPEVDYDSDSESTTSSRCSGYSGFSSKSFESVTSVSTTSLDEKPRHSDTNIAKLQAKLSSAEKAATAATPAPVVAAPAQRYTIKPKPKAPVTSRKPLASVPLAQPQPESRSLSPKSRYTYQGGETSVVTGGVMLGGPTRAPVNSATKGSQPKSGGVKSQAKASTTTSAKLRKGASESGDWRRRA